jgi:hypothetical protein
MREFCVTLKEVTARRSIEDWTISTDKEMWTLSTSSSNQIWIRPLVVNRGERLFTSTNRVFAQFYHYNTVVTMSTACFKAKQHAKFVRRVNLLPRYKSDWIWGYHSGEYERFYLQWYNGLHFQGWRENQTRNEHEADIMLISCLVCSSNLNVALHSRRQRSSISDCFLTTERTNKETQKN